MKVGIVSSDAGGGELLSSYVNLNPGNYFFSIKGPSIDIFKRKVNRFKNYSLSEIISKVDLLICGTSAISNHELNAINMANNIETISIIDHWHYYKERFLRNGTYIFPKTFWVTDNYAFALFKKNFPKNKCILIENPYIKECKIEYNLLKSKQKKLIKNKILFISQKSEPTLLKSFLVNFQSYFKDFELIVRPHPAETIKSFSWLSNFKFPNLIIEKKKISD